MAVTCITPALQDSVHGFLVVGALWLQSLHAVLWTTLWFSPAWILYVRLQEERGLELRFGESYPRYKAQTAFGGLIAED